MSPPDPRDSAQAEGHGISNLSSFASLLCEGVEQNPQGPALISLYQKKDPLPALLLQNNSEVEHTVWTYQELQQAAGRLATILHGHGIRKGSTVATFLWNSIEWVTFCWAAAALNAAFAPLDPRCIDRSNELRHVLETLNVDVLVVQGRSAAKSLETTASDVLKRVKLKILCDETSIKDDWLALRTMQDKTPMNVDWSLAGGASTDEDIALILFTSGTTSLPKACGHTGSNLSSQSYSYRKSRRMNRSSKLIMHSPNFHMAGFWSVLCAWRAGATLVIPSPRFEPGATLKGIESQGCTHLQGTPTMITTILDSPSFQAHEPSTIQFVSIGAEIVPPDLIQRIKNRLGSDVVVWSGWGMTEGIGIISWEEDEEIPPRNGVLPIGRVMAGAKIRICEEGSQQAVSRGVEGELHVAGTSVIRGYLNPAVGDPFYTDDGYTWLATGDRALMDGDGRVFILGRYKDIIIRGGENLSPAALEASLNRYQGIQSQVVGIPDPVMGEVPIAIIKKSSIVGEAPGLQSTLSEMVIRDLGTACALAGVLALEDLDITDFPMTPSGKIRKGELKTLVTKHMHQLQQHEAQKSRYSMIARLAEIWSRVLGYSVDENYHLLADSLTVMRFCYEVEKLIGQRISLEQVYSNDTIQKQASLLQDGEPKIQKFRRQETSNLPPSPQDMIPTFGNLATAGKAAELLKPALQALNLTWQSDVEAVYRNNDVMADIISASQRAVSANIRWAYAVEGITTGQLRQALEEALTRNSTLGSICVKLENQNPVHVVVRPSQRWFETCMTFHAEVDTVDGVRALLPSRQLDFAGPPGPSFRAVIVPITDSSSLGLVMSVHHSTFDAFFMSAFFHDLDEILSDDRGKLRDRTPFTRYADVYNLHRKGPVAMEQVRHCASKLRGVKKHTKALWPMKKGSEWFTGDDTGWTYPDGSPGRPEERQREAFDREEDRPLGVARKSTCSHLRTLKADHNIEPSTVVKAAVTLFNTRTTNEQHAVFCNLDSARSWPFLEKWITDQLPNPLDIAGPTMGCTINVLPVNSVESVLAFLARIQQDQKEQSSLANTPFHAVMDQLGPEEGQIIYDIARRQMFNWDSTSRTRLSNSYKSLRLLGRQGWLDVGVFWNFGLMDDETLVSFMLYDDAHLRHAEAAGALDMVIEIVHWISAPENWKKNVGEYGGNYQIMD